MARKKKPEEPENLERWLVSYADFMTLLFATFVVLYALSQTDVSEFEKLESTLKSAFGQNSSSLLEGNQSILTDGSGDSVMDSITTNGEAPNPLMLEYISTKYENTSYNDIKEDIGNMKLSGVETTINENGMTIKLPQSVMDFKPNSAELTDKSKNLLFDIGKIIFSRFQIHLIRVEGHTDSSPTATNGIYPSNWELSSARSSSVINYFIKEFGTNPHLFMSVGYADTIPLKGLKPTNSKNRRVEITIIRNRQKSNYNNNLSVVLNKGEKPSYVKIQYQKVDARNVIENKELVAPESVKPTKESSEIKSLYENENHRLRDKEAQYISAPSFVREDK